MKAHPFRQSPLKKLTAILAALVLCTGFLPHLPRPTTAYAAEGRLYNQYDPYWKTVTFNKYCNTSNSMYISGCGIFSFCNAIYALNSIVLDAPEVGAWGVDNGSYRPGNGGLYRDLFYADVEEAWGERAQFKLEGCYVGSVTDERLIEHMKSGGVAVLHVPGHFIALTGYDETNGMYRIVESAVSSNRNLAPEGWVTAWKLSNGRTACMWYAMLSNTKPPEKAEVRPPALYPAALPVPIVAESDIRGNFAVGVDDAGGNRVGTFYSQRPGYSCVQTVECQLPAPGTYTCYASSFTDLGYVNSEPVSFTLYDTPPESASLYTDKTAYLPGEQIQLAISGGLAEECRIIVTDENGNEVYSTTESHGFHNDAPYYTAYTPELPGIYNVRAELCSPYGTAESRSVTVNVLSEVPLTLEANGGMVRHPSMTVIYGQPYGSLPDAIRTGYQFCGWFLEDGTRVHAEDMVDIAAAHTLYAKWSAPIGFADPGDLNGDGMFDLADIILMSRILAEDETLENAALMIQRSDLNADGYVDSRDLLLLMSKTQ